MNLKQVGLLLCIIISTLGVAKGQDYRIPKPNFEAIFPKGLRIYIPDDGYSHFSFHGKLNEMLKGLEWNTTWSADLSKPKKGKWTYEDKNVILISGDNIYYWYYVVKNGKNYVEADGVHTVTEFLDERSIDDPNFAVLRPKKEQDLSLLPPCKVSETTVSGQTKSPCQGTLVFSEDFNKPSLEESKNWDPEIKFADNPDYYFNVYEREESVKLQSGSLVIKPLVMPALADYLDLDERCTGKTQTSECVKKAWGSLIIPPILSAKITTKKHFSFKYGRVEISAKLPSGLWLIPELLLEPLDNFYGETEYASGIMRVAFTLGTPSGSKELFGGPILSSAGQYRTKLLKKKKSDKDWSETFHNYTLIWKPDGIQLFVDSDHYGSIDPDFYSNWYDDDKEKFKSHAGTWIHKKKQLMVPLNKMFYLSVGVGVGGVADFPDVPEKPWKNKSIKGLFNFWNNRDTWLPTWTDPSLVVDHIRVYAL